MDAMIINTTDTSSLNALITLALKQTIHAAVQAAIEDKLADLDADTASVAASMGQRITALDRFTAGLDRALVTSIGDQFSFNTQMQSRILALEKRLDTLSLINTSQEDALAARIQVLEEEVGRLQHAHEVQKQERDDTIADIVDTRLEMALEDIDLTEQVRNVLSDATITI
jgi:hypothetical protein